MAMTIAQLCAKCEALNKEFNTSARQMDGRELAAYRRRLMMKYDAGFVNGWTVRLCRNVEDVFTVGHTQLWTKTDKKMFGRKSAVHKLRLALSHPALPDVQITAIAEHGESPESGSEIRISGELEAVLFLHPDGVQWKSAAFLKNVRIVQE